MVRNIIGFVAAVTLGATAHADSTGVIYAGLGQNGVTSVGTTSWSIPANAQGAPNSIGAAALVGLGPSDSLDLFNYSFSIPSNATILGVQVTVTALDQNFAPPLLVSLNDGATATMGTSQSTPALTTSYATYTLGGPTDLWDTSGTLTPALVNGGSLGATVVQDEDIAWTEIDAVGIEVFYIVGQTTGIVYPTSSANGTISTGLDSWSDLGNALGTPDSLHATTTIPFSQGPGEADSIELYDFAFSIPTGRIISGIEVTLTSAASTEFSSGHQFVATLTDGGTTLLGTSRSTPNVGDLQTRILGGQADLWDVGTPITVDDLNGGTFGISIRGTSTDTFGTVFYLDAVGVEVFHRAPSSVWVDFAHTDTEDGSEANPYNTLAEALANVAAEGTVFVKGDTATSDSNETMTINQAATIEAVSGTVRIGDQGARSSSRSAGFVSRPRR